MLSSIIPQADYAEDQKAAKSILWTHVLYRGFQTGTVIGLGIGLARGFSKRKTVSFDTIRQMLLQSTGTGAFLGTASMIIILPIRMMGREDIEWKDRSYRLLANKSQEQVDDWTSSATLLGVGTVILTGMSNQPHGLRAVAGGAGLGSLGGLVALIVYRLAFAKKNSPSKIET